MTADDTLTQISEKTCAKCGGSRFNKENRCLPCLAQRKAQYRKNNPNMGKASGAAYRLANREHLLANKRSWHSTNKERINTEKKAKRLVDPEKGRAAQRESYKRNREKINQRSSLYYKSNQIKMDAKNKAYREANREKVNACMRIVTQNRRAKQRKNGGVLSKGLAKRLFMLQKGKCPCCQQPLGKNYHMDHIIPIFMGGANTDDNIQLLRRRCNIQKTIKHPINFMQERGFLL